MKAFPKAHSLSFLLILSVFVFSGSASGQTASVSVSPPSQAASLFSTQEIAVNVSIKDVSNLYGYQFDVIYDSNALRLAASQSVTEGPFLKQGGTSTFFIAPNTGTLGYINNMACTRQAPSTGVSGSGNLTRIKFIPYGVAASGTQIRLSNIKLSNINSQPITFTSFNGVVTVYECFNGEARECPCVGWCGGSTGKGARTCSGNAWGSCVCPNSPTQEICNNIDDDCDGLTDENASGNPMSRSCSTTHYGRCAAGTETCSAGAWSGCLQPIQEICGNGIDEDCDGSDSTCKGDITGCADGSSDGCIDIEDLALVATEFGKTSGFNTKVDIKVDGVVDIFDLVAVAKDFGSGTCKSC